MPVKQLSPKQVLKKLIPLADAHQRADEYIAGVSWIDEHMLDSKSGSGGCAVGCTIHDAKALGLLSIHANNYSHQTLATITGIHEQCWVAADKVFEGLSNSLRPGWTPRFLRAALSCKLAPQIPVYRVAVKLLSRIYGQLTRAEICAQLPKRQPLARVVLRLRAFYESRDGDPGKPHRKVYECLINEVNELRETASMTREGDIFKAIHALTPKHHFGGLPDLSYGLFYFGLYENEDEKFWAWCGDMLCTELTR